MTIGSFLISGLRNMEGELCAFADLAFDPDRAPVRMDDAARNRKTQPRASAAAA